MTWHRGRMLAWDTETTGPDPNFARIVTCTAIELGPNGIERTHQWLVNPGVEIPAGATAVHGITTARALEDGMDAGRAIFEITGLLALSMHRGVPVVGFNLAYDATVLDRECRRQGVDSLDRRGTTGPMVDSHVLDKHCDPYRRGKRTLGVTCERYGIDLGNAHDATADALGAARLAYKLAEAYPEQLQVPLEDLHAQHVAWRAEQAAGLQAYFRKKDPTAVVNGEWPVQALPSGWAAGFHPVDETAVA